MPPKGNANFAWVQHFIHHLAPDGYAGFVLANIATIADTYHAWRGDKDAGKYEDIAGFCKSATTTEIAAHGHVLSPGRYVGAEEVEDDGESFEEKIEPACGGTKWAVCGISEVGEGDQSESWGAGV